MPFSAMISWQYERVPPADSSDDLSVIRRATPIRDALPQCLRYVGYQIRLHRFGRFKNRPFTRPMSDATAVPSDVKLLLRLLDINGNPYATKECLVEWGGKVGGNKSISATTDALGLLSVKVPSKQTVFTVTVKLFTVEANNPKLTVYMQKPVSADKVVGMKRRLNNLGYLALEPKEDVETSMDDLALRALERFRCANDILNADCEPVGPTAAPFGVQTRQRIEDAHDTTAPLELPQSPTAYP